jgi:hypothetical protein
VYTILFYLNDEKLSIRKIKTITKNQRFKTHTETVRMDNVQHRKAQNLNPLQKCDIALLLQQSPVATFDQIIRLKGIENSWANWVTDYSGKSSSIRLYAAFPNTSSSIFTTFKIIKPIYLSNNQTKLSPFLNLIQALVTLITNDEINFHWIVYGNDHTFFIPGNLLCFLRSYDHDIPIISGNKLQRGLYKNFPLYFPSGGAGACLSHISIKLFLLSLVLNGNKVMKESITFSTEYCPISLLQNDELILHYKKTSFLCILKQLMNKSLYSNKVSLFAIASLSRLIILCYLIDQNIFIV